MSRRGAYYNENDRGAAAWLRELIAEGQIPAGDVDERSIRDVRCDDLRGYVQHHFFAGIGIWPHALRRAGWPDLRPVWTGSCPCQPFSSAGKGLGFDDPRHLWPDWLRLIVEFGPDRIFGEQVASAGAWLDLVSADLESHGFAFGSVDLAAAGFDGAHIRQRFFWVADADNAERWAERAPRNDGDGPRAGRIESHGDAGERGAAGWMGDAGRHRSHEIRGDDGEVRGLSQAQCQSEHGPAVSGRSGAIGRLENANGERCDRQLVRLQSRRPFLDCPEVTGRGEADWLFCRDRRWRPVEPGASPLALAAPGRVGRLRGYGNGLDSETATQFVAAYLGAEAELSSASHEGGFQDGASLQSGVAA